ncbi:MAG: 3-deoxy-D-manno-octulosonic acid transferase, partial [Synergistes sp.]|nr:3-deoxy-D-manno-octulosonic acid transferase [Synergistes sp.]
MAKYTEGNDEREGKLSEEKLSLLKGERPIWVHAVSVGEVQAAVPFIKAAREDGYKGAIVLSTTTQTGKAMAERLAGGLYDFHFYYQWDKKKFVERRLDALHPAIFMAAETELWPNLLWECKERGIPAFLFNGRISDRTYSRFKSTLGRKAAASLYSLFTELYLRDDEDARRLSETGVASEKLHVLGDSKIDALLARKNYEARDGWLKQFGSPERPIFIAGSTHTGEDEKVVFAFERLRSEFPLARLIIAPRHPERSDSLLSLIPEKYITIKLSEIREGWDVLIVDRIGVLFDLYGTAFSAFVGGSFADKGGQNILEPFSWGIPIQYG